MDLLDCDNLGIQRRLLRKYYESHLQSILGKYTDLLLRGTDDQTFRKSMNLADE